MPEHLVVAEDRCDESGASFLASLRISRPDVIRILVIDAVDSVCSDTVARAAV